MQRDIGKVVDPQMLEGLQIVMLHVSCGAFWICQQKHEDYVQQIAERLRLWRSGVINRFSDYGDIVTRTIDC